ncbi:MAG: hypothetical protein LLG13_11010 [Bacteroidales bacterium]|nr:hypothetical protein [Bacteroidales bacterium]
MIEYITYQGKKYPIRVSYYVIMMAQKESGLKLEQIDTNLESQQTIIWYALIAGHKMAKKELTLTREECVWILDECYIEFQKAIFQFGQSLVDMQEECLNGGKEGKDKKKLSQ